MGYYTDFNLSVHEHDNYDEVDKFLALGKELGNYDYVSLNDPINIEKIANKFKLDKDILLKCNLGEYSDLLLDTYFNSKWYTHEKDIAQFSRLFPSVVFLLEGNGEDSSDLWKCYAKNGKIFLSLGSIYFKPYSPDKLEEVVEDR